LYPAVSRGEPENADGSDGQASVSETAREESRLWFAKGGEAYASGDYAAAVSAFRRAYELLPAPALLFNIAQALRMNGSCEEAVTYYRLFEQGGVELPADFPQLAAQARHCAEEQRLASTRPQETESQRISGAQPAPPTVEQPALKSPSARPGATGTVPLVVSARPDAEAVAVDSGRWTTREWIGVSCLGLAVAGGATAIVLGLRAERAADETTELSDADEARWDDEARQNEEDGIAAGRWAVALTVGSAVAAGAGAWLLWSAPSDTSSVAVSPGGVRWSARF
jgi:hypothetical protein